MYYVFFVLVSLLCFLTSISKYELKSFYFIVLVMLLCGISALRFEVGTDYNNYVYLFQLIIENSAKNIEPSMVILVNLFDYVGINLQLIFVFYSIVTVLGYVLFIRYFSTNIGLSLFLYFSLAVFFFASLNLIRQFSAVAVFLFSIRYIVSRDLFKYVFCILVATVFHFSSILLLPLYFFLTRKFSFKFYILGFISIYFAMNLLESIARLTKYSVYLDRVFENAPNIYMSIAFCGIALFFILVRRFFNMDNPMFHVIINMNYLSLLLISSSLYSKLPELIFFRYNYFFMPSLLILIPLFIQLIKPKVIQPILIAFLFVLSGLYYYQSTVVNGVKNDLVPYKFILLQS